MAALTDISIVSFFNAKNTQVVQLDTSNGKKTYMLKKLPKQNAANFTIEDNRDALCAYGNVILHNMYDMDKIWYHNQAARRHRYPYETEFDYQHIYRRPANVLPSLSTSICCVAQAKNTIYAIDEAQKAGHSFVNDYMYQWLSNDNGFATPRTRLIDTALYEVFADSLSNHVIGEESLSTTSSNTYYLSTEVSSKGAGIYATSSLVGVNYNTIYEIPNIVQDYYKGELIANTFKTKNQFDGRSWSMVSVDAEILHQAREYLGIYSCGDQLWLKWKDVKRYTVVNQDSTISSDAANAISVALSTDIDSTVPYPQVEVIAAINRGIQEPSHKSTMYSLDLRTRIVDNFNSTLTGNNKREKILQNLKQEIKNNIRKIAESIAPANCQLFSVTIDS